MKPKLTYTQTPDGVRVDQPAPPKPAPKKPTDKETDDADE